MSENKKNIHVSQIEDLDNFSYEVDAVHYTVFFKGEEIVSDGLDASFFKNGDKNVNLIGNFRRVAKTAIDRIVNGYGDAFVYNRIAEINKKTSGN